MLDYPKKQLQELYKNLPKDLREAGFSKENARNIQEICTKNGITDEDIIFDVAKNVGYVFLGLLPPNEFSYILEKELKIEKSKAELITSEIVRFVFLPVRKSLEALYKTKINISIKPGSVVSPETPPSLEENQSTAGQPEAGKPEKKDIYRETIK